MKKRNKWFLIISSITAITSPIFISAACGTKNSEPDKKTEVVSKDNLRSKINEVNSFIDSLNDAKYSSIKTELNTEKNTSSEVLNNASATQQQVDQAITRLETALNNAKANKQKIDNPKKNVDKSQLISKIQELQTYIDQNLSQQQYNSIKQKLLNVKTSAQAVVDNNESTDANVTESINSLTTKIQEAKVSKSKVDLETEIIKANALITSLSEQKYNQIKEELKAEKDKATTIKNKNNVNVEELNSAKGKLSAAIAKANQDKAELDKAPTVITASKSFKDVQLVFAFKDTLVKEALKSLIDQGWMFENLEEVSQQDNAANTDNSDTSGTQESNQSGEETPAANTNTPAQPTATTNVGKLVKDGLETFIGKKLKTGSQTDYDYLNVVLRGITKTAVTYEQNDLSTLSGTNHLEIDTNQSFNHNPNGNELSKIVDGNERQESRWDTWAFYGKQQDAKNYITIKIKENDEGVFVNKFNLWTRVRGYSLGPQSNKAFPTKYIKLYYSLDGTKFERVKNQDKETKDQLFTLTESGEVSNVNNNNTNTVEINFDPVKAKYIRFEFEAPEIEGIKGQTIPGTQETATTNYGVVGFNEVKIIKLTDSGKTKWENSNNIETYKNLDQINIPENIAIEFNVQNNIPNSFLLGINNNSTKTIQVNDNIDLSTLSSTHITIKNRESENNSSALHDNLGVVIEEIQTQTLNNKIISKQFKITLIKDNENKKVITLNVQHNN
ncbi:discoidin domain-containing protein [Mycoplasmopsis felis]|uniref:discoidin domain-containing protein n=1 Tax=Mycoplasmopsis felis TaxID=33923 RepID=UPI002AFFCB9E|nr:discoidin domain-containing protein [Mycoplasmopsis felis]WQQ09438.1 discoidin domain-containing protein [Mycoplasmopsis felis]